MPRGGRGGRGGGTRGGRGGGKQRIGGQEVSWDYDPDLVIDTKPQDVFPEIELPKARPPTRLEKTQVENYRAVRKRIHEGPFYTVLGDNARVSKSSSTRAANFNPFESMPTYTRKYTAPLRQLPRFDTRKYILKFFPTELWDTIDPSRAKKNGAMPRPKRKQNVGVDETEEVVEEEEGGPKPGDDEDAEEAKKGDDDEQPEEENPDETFSEDDDEMAGDYNGEQYFDNGDEDDNDGGGGGDGDDDGYD